MGDLIDRKAAIEAFADVFNGTENTIMELTFNECKSVIESLLSAQLDYDLSGYSDKLWKAAYERGKEERKTGKWILVKGSNGKDYHKCSECLHTQDITGVKNYCAVCGADMRKEEMIE